MNKRAKANTNLRLTFEPTFNGKRIYQSKYGVVVDYLKSMEGLFEKAFREYGRLLVVRFDLHYPNLPNIFTQSSDITDFFKKLDYQFSAERLKRIKRSGRAHSCTTRGFWCIEQATSHNPHYHVALVLNDAFFGRLGKYKGSDKSLAHFIQLSWARVLGIELADLTGLVDFADNGTYRLRRANGIGSEEFQDMFYRVSYLAKLNTKHYGDHKKSFGASRK